jgi:hypothetical protein
MYMTPFHANTAKHIVKESKDGLITQNRDPSTELLSHLSCIFVGDSSISQESATILEIAFLFLRITFLFRWVS